MLLGLWGEPELLEPGADLLGYELANEDVSELPNRIAEHLGVPAAGAVVCLGEELVHELAVADRAAFFAEARFSALPEVAAGLECGFGVAFGAEAAPVFAG